jgi:alkanesulfonate monooxygenase SsuD/methylene tetrahydromethanopterin reductase-like flavin-dependent oxidoreductase (luciferase family)
MGSQVDDLSGGRLSLGIGAGWNVREHAMFGYDLLDVPPAPRSLRGRTGSDHAPAQQRPAGQLQRQIQPPAGPDPAAASGAARRTADPDRGNGEKRTLPLVARYAREWNGVFITAEEYARRNRVLDDLLLARGPSRRRAPFPDDPDRLWAGRGEYRRVLVDSLGIRPGARGIVAARRAVVEKLGRLAEARAQRVMLQWLAWTIWIAGSLRADGAAQV